jgi:hypothetical protein
LVEEEMSLQRKRRQRKLLDKRRKMKIEDDDG